MKVLLLLVLLHTSTTLPAAHLPHITIPTSPREPVVVKEELPAATPEEAAFWQKALAELKAEAPSDPVMSLRSAQKFTAIFSDLHMLARTTGLTVDAIALRGNVIYQTYSAYLATIDPKYRDEIEGMEQGFMWKEIEWLNRVLKPQPQVCKPQPRIRVIQPHFHK